MTNPKDEAAAMPDEIWYSQKTVENNGKEYTIHFVSVTETEENKTRYHIAEGFEKYLADRVDARLSELSNHPTPAQAQGESVTEDMVRFYRLFRKQFLNCATCGFAFRDGGVCESCTNPSPKVSIADRKKYGYGEFRPNLKPLQDCEYPHAPEVVTVEEFYAFIDAQLARYGIEGDIANNIADKYPHGLIIKRTE